MCGYQLTPRFLRRSRRVRRWDVGKDAIMETVRFPVAEIDVRSLAARIRHGSVRIYNARVEEHVQRVSHALHSKDERRRSAYFIFSTPLTRL